MQKTDCAQSVFFIVLNKYKYGEFEVMVSIFKYCHHNTHTICVQKIAVVI